MTKLTNLFLQMSLIQSQKSLMMILLGMMIDMKVAEGWRMKNHPQSWSRCLVVVVVES